MTEIGIKGKQPSPSKTCEEASIFSASRCIACGKSVTAQVYHPRDNRTYAMCTNCANHNIANRGGKLVEPPTE